MASDLQVTTPSLWLRRCAIIPHSLPLMILANERATMGVLDGCVSVRACVCACGGKLSRVGLGKRDKPVVNNRRFADRYSLALYMWVQIIAGRYIHICVCGVGGWLQINAGRARSTR